MIARYHCQGSSGYMSESEHGDYVTHAEYERLEVLLRECLLEGSGYGRSPEAYLPPNLRMRIEGALGMKP